MYKIILSLLLYGLITILYADSATQTDWSGYRKWGPVNNWGTNYYATTDIMNHSVLMLQYLENTVDGDFDGAFSVYSADVNGDGYMDILGASVNTDDINWWENVDGSGTSWIEHNVDGDFYGAYCIHSADVNGDGYMDVIGAAWLGDDITWWENMDGSGTSWIEHTIDGDFDGAFSVYSVDVNGDGYMDILGAAVNTDDITWWENVGGSGTSWIEHTIDGNFYHAVSVYSADVNGDGYMDVLGADYLADDITWWENVDGSGNSWIEHTVEGDFDEASSIYSADINGDGYMDILGASHNQCDITWWENVDGSGTSWIEHTVAGDYIYASTVYSADLNGDGYMDVLGGAGAVDITWWENVDGSGTSWIEHIVDGDYVYVHSVYSADVNGDGHLDVLGAGHVYDDITWWNLVGYPSDGYLESSCLYLRNDPGWGFIDWTAEEPPGTSVSFQVRSCDSPDIAGMGSWSDTLYTPCSLSGLLAEGDSYFQYKAILQTSDTTSTPVLDDVTLTWNPTGIEESEYYSLLLLPFTPNPSSSPQVEFYLPEACCARFSIFDMSGRLVSEIDETEYPAGYRIHYLNELNPGIYYCRMITDDFTETQQFVVIE